jgi:hypothetical protein
MLLRKLNHLIFATAALGLFGCGHVKTGKENTTGADKDEDAAATLSCGESSQDNSTSEFRLKGASLLAQTYQQTLGAGITLDVNTNTDLFKNEAITSSIGTSRDGMYADIKSPTQEMTSYVMTLSFLGRTAALNCSKTKFEGLCACNSQIAAAGMLQRAITFRRFCPDDGDELVERFVQLCTESPIDAISSLMTSISVALLQ